MLKTIGSKMASIVLVLFGVGVFALMIMLTFGSLGRIFPNDIIKQASGLLLFDLGALVWLVVFVSASRGAMQRALALLMFVFCVLGAIGMAGADALMSGQGYVTVPEWVGEGIVYLFIVATAVNLLVLYVHHLNNPNISTAIRMQAQQDKLVDEALETVERNLDEKRRELAAKLADKLEHGALLEMGLLADSNIVDAKFTELHGPADKVQRPADNVIVTPPPAMPNPTPARPSAPLVQPVPAARPSPPDTDMAYRRWYSAPPAGARFLHLGRNP